MTMAERVTRSAFAIAAHSGDVSTVQRYLAQGDVMQEMKAFAVRFRSGARISPSAHLPTWFESYQCVWCQNDAPVSLQVLQWLFYATESGNEASLLVHTLTYLLAYVLLPHTSAIGDAAAIDVLLASPVYCDHMTASQQIEATTKALSTAVDATIADLLLSHGADPQSVLRQSGIQPWDAPRFASHSCVRLVLENGAFIVGNDSIVCEEVRGGCTAEFVRDLLSMGADPGDALVEAAGLGRLDLIEALAVEGKVDVDRPRPLGPTPMAQAIMRGLSLDSSENGRAFEVVALLLTHGADVNARGGDGCFALTSAAAHGHLAMLRVLLEHGADPNLFFLQTPLYALCDRFANTDRVECLALLVSFGADPNLANRGESHGRSSTPLERLVRHGYRDEASFQAIKVLVNAGVDLNKPCQDGTIPIECWMKDDEGKRWVEQLRRMSRTSLLPVM